MATSVSAGVSVMAWRDAPLSGYIKIQFLFCASTGRCAMA
ncbi:hypothetical protein APS_0838 [Acetobacter pasteurianus subsp. pasteurianus LMG 1262 = NBRC 106471]|nr:hypothetical protein APS_0838 [Acetobacter pasteurianus subsp. pasteurianus LMG 1262 = NBRC 106471]